MYDLPKFTWLVHCWPSFQLILSFFLSFLPFGQFLFLQWLTCAIFMHLFNFCELEGSGSQINEGIFVTLTFLNYEVSKVGSLLLITFWLRPGFTLLVYVVIVSIDTTSKKQSSPLCRFNLLPSPFECTKKIWLKCVQPKVTKTEEYRLQKLPRESQPVS